MPMSKPELLFQRMFHCITPKGFITLFSPELPQTKAFILSFSLSKGYVRRVLRLLDAQESQGQDPCKRSSNIILGYLQRCLEDTIDLTFVKAVEDEVNAIIAGYEDMSDLRGIRKRRFFCQPKEVLAKRKESNRLAKEIK
jgi:hypothetical protein